jgi:hypothetical protein
MDSKKWESLHGPEIEDVSFRRLVRKVMARIPRADAKEFPPFRVLQSPLPEDQLGHGSENVTLDADKMNALGMSEDAKIAVIAHEFAHVFLNHIDASWNDEDAQTMEDEADEKASQWGFGKELSTLHETRKKLRLRIRF